MSPIGITSHLRYLAPLLLLLGAPLAHAQRNAASPSGPRILPGLELWVSGYNDNRVHRFSLTEKGTSLGRLPNVRGAQSIQMGPDGLHYIVAEKRDEVLRFRRANFVDRFVWDDPATLEDETGGLSGATGAIFGPSGHLYVGGFNSDNVIEYDGQTGAFLREFVPAGRGGLDGPDAGIIFGPDGDLYVPSFDSDEVLRYDGENGAFRDVFMAAGTGGLRNPRTLLFMEDDTVLVSSWSTNRILRFDLEGEFIEQVAAYQRPTGMAIGPHDGLLYVTSDNADRVWRFDLVRRVKLGTIVPVGAQGLSGATFIRFVEPWGPLGLPLPPR